MLYYELHDPLMKDQYRGVFKDLGSDMASVIIEHLIKYQKYYHPVNLL